MASETQSSTAPSRSWKRRLNTSNVVAISAIFISLCSLYVSLIEVQTMRLQQEASIYPHLDLQTQYSSEGFKLILSNQGVGLAKIESYTVFAGEAEFRDWLEVVDFFLPKGHKVGYNIMTANTIANRVIPAGESIVLMGVPWTPETRQMVDRAVSELGIVICYSSLMEKTWTISHNTDTPVEGACPESGRMQFK
jgi:hypothetical protein